MNAISITISPRGRGRVKVEEFDGALVLDCYRPGDRAKSTGPRFWLERAKDGKQHGWKLIIHPDDGDATHCVFISDKHQETKVFGCEFEDPEWPTSL
jgi:hypothetical protein